MLSDEAVYHPFTRKSRSCLRLNKPYLGWLRELHHQHGTPEMVSTLLLCPSRTSLSTCTLSRITPIAPYLLLRL